MNDQPTEAKSSSMSMGVPLAIVLAGAIIAAAVYFRPAGNTKQVSVQPTPAGPTIGDFRAVDAARDHIRGAVNAQVTVIEYSDLECPFCKQFHNTMVQLLEEYPNDVRWVYRHFPLDELHSQARAEANAAECAGEQGKFWEFIDKIFEVTPSNNGLDLAKLPDYARDVSVPNISQFELCVAGNTHATRVSDDVTDAKSAGGTGTPYSVVIGPQGDKTPINGAQPYNVVKATIDSLLK